MRTEKEIQDQLIESMHNKIICVEKRDFYNAGGHQIREEALRWVLGVKSGVGYNI